jgi:hypothetical protein
MKKNIYIYKERSNAVSKEQKIKEGRMMVKLSL